MHLFYIVSSFKSNFPLRGKLETWRLYFINKATEKNTKVNSTISHVLIILTITLNITDETSHDVSSFATTESYPFGRMLHETIL